MVASAVSFSFVPSVMFSTLSSFLRARVGSNTYYQKEEIVLERLSAEISRLEVKGTKRENTGVSSFFFQFGACLSQPRPQHHKKKTPNLLFFCRPTSPSAPSASPPGPRPSAPTASPASSSRPPSPPRRPGQPPGPTPRGSTSRESRRCSSSPPSSSRRSPSSALWARRSRPATSGGCGRPGGGCARPWPTSRTRRGSRGRWRFWSSTTRRRGRPRRGRRGRRRRLPRRRSRRKRGG